MKESGPTFADYENRFERLVGIIQPGQYGRYNNRLVRRLTADAYAEQWSQYQQCGQKLMVAIENGETLSEQLIVQIRSIEANLVLEKSSYLP